MKRVQRKIDGFAGGSLYYIVNHDSEDVGKDLAELSEMEYMSGRTFYSMTPELGYDGSAGFEIATTIAYWVVFMSHN